MALGWVLSEGLAVDPTTGEVLDLTIRSFGVVPARNTPRIDVTIVDDAGDALSARVRRRVRRGCGCDVERGRRRGRNPPGVLPRP